MAYNNYFPATYPQSYPQPTVTPQQPTSSIVWVQGIEGAKAYPVGAGNSVLLMDSEESVFYIKSTDTSGMPHPLRIFTYTEQTESAPSGDYVTRAELEARLAELTKEKKDEQQSV